MSDLFDAVYKLVTGIGTIGIFTAVWKIASRVGGIEMWIKTTDRQVSDIGSLVQQQVTKVAHIEGLIEGGKTKNDP